MAKYFVWLVVIVFLSNVGVLQSFRQRIKERPKVNSSLRGRLTYTAPDTEYFFDGSGSEGSGLGRTNDDDDDDDDDYIPDFGSGIETEPPPTFPPPGPASSLTTPLRIHQTTVSTATGRTVDVEPDTTKDSPSTESVVTKKEGGHFAVPDLSTLASSTPHSSDTVTTRVQPESSTDAETSDSVTNATLGPSTGLDTTIVITTQTTTTSPSTIHPTPRSTFHRPSRRTTTTKAPTTTTTATTRSDDTDEYDDNDDDDITEEEYPDVNNKLDPSPGKGDPDVSIDLNEEQTNEVHSNQPTMYRVSNLPRLAFIGQSGVLAGIIAGSIIVLLLLVLFIMFVVYHLKRKSEPAFDRPARSPAKAGYKKALDKDMYG